MTVIAPADAYETARAVSAAIEMEGPVYIRMGEDLSRHCINQWISISRSARPSNCEKALMLQ